MPMSMFFFVLGGLFLIRDLLVLNINQASILLLSIGTVIFVFALIAEQISCLRKELLSQDKGA